MPNELTCPNCDSVYDVSELPELSAFHCPKCQALLRIPGKFGPYLLEFKCGVGGTSHIYRARDSRNGGTVAVKILKKNYVTAGKNPFQREISLLETLPEIPGLVPILEYGVVAKRPFMAMPFYPGSDAEKRRRGHTLPPEQALFKVFYELSETLGKLHEFHVVHHDIKSSNIFFDAEDSAFLGDLDVADFRADGDRTTPCLNWVSPAYSSPEKLENGSEDHKGDVFSLGVTAYELLCDRRPFSVKGDVYDLLDERRRRAFPTPHQDRPDFDRELSDLIMSMMEFDPDMRPDYPEISVVFKLLAEA